MRISKGASTRDYLKNSTKDLHHRLDAAASRFELDTLAGYGEFLAAQAKALIPLELALEQAGIERLLPDWASRCRRDALGRDLAELGLAAEPFSTPTIRSEAALMGAAYVLEGSRLGARMVLAQIGAQTATRYLRHGEGRKLWPGFLAILESNREVRCVPHDAVFAARASFTLFIRAMPQRAMAVAS